MVDKCTAIAEMVAKNKEMVNARSKPVHPKKSFYAKYLKRLIDLIIVIPVFLLLLPVNLVIGIVTFFDVGSPIFFKQKRTGKGGRSFNLVKFRNMTNEKTNSEIFFHLARESQSGGRLFGNTPLMNS